MKKIKDALTRKIGPLPAWGWLSIAGIAFYLYYRNSGSGTSADQAQASAAGQTQGYYGPYGEGNYPIDSGGGGSYGGGSGSGDTGGNGASGTAPAGGLPGPEPPVINVNGSRPHPKRTPKPKAQHKVGSSVKGTGRMKGISKGVKDKGLKAIPRSKGTLHGGRQHPRASGAPRVTSKHNQRHTSSPSLAPKVNRKRHK